MPPSVLCAVLNKDPVPGFKDHIKDRQTFFQKLGRPENQAVRGGERLGWITSSWNWSFLGIKADRLHLLTSGGPLMVSSNELDGKKWIVTKVVQLKDKPVCWCLPVEVKNGETIKAILTEENMLDLGSIFDSVLGKTDVSAEGSKKVEEWQKKMVEEWNRKSWRIALDLRSPGPGPIAVPYTILNYDPVPGFKASVKKMQPFYREKGERAGNEVVWENERQARISLSWDGVFKRMAGSLLHLLVSNSPVSSSAAEPDCKRWIVTRIVQIKGKPVCWCIPVAVKSGQEVKVTLAEDNVFDLGAAFDSALREADPPK